MSKKSRKRNKKILGALAAGLGAMALAKRKKASIADMDDAAINVTHPALTAKNFITKKVTDAAQDTSGSRFDTRFTRDGIGPNELSGYSKKVRGVLPPSELVSTARPNRFGTLYKGGGIAKRGVGAAFKKGGHVKSMGIAKRGGGAAKR